MAIYISLIAVKHFLRSPRAHKEALEELLFNHPDPYDLAEVERLRFGDPDAPAVTRSATVFAIAEYIKLDSPALAELMQPSKPGKDKSWHHRVVSKRDVRTTGLWTSFWHSL